MDRKDCDDGSAGAESDLSSRRPPAPLAGAIRSRLTIALLALLALAATLVSVAPADAVTLPDGRQWELVSPPVKHGSQVEPDGSGVGGLLGGVAEASVEGNGLTFVTSGPVEGEPTGNRAIEGTQVLAQRAGGSSPSWSSHEIITPVLNAEGFESGEPQEYRYFSPKLEFALVQPFGLQGNPFQEPPLVPGVAAEERGIYRRHNLTCEVEPNTCFEPLVNGEDQTFTIKGQPVAWGGKLKAMGASENLQHVVFEAPVPLTATASKEGGLYEWNAEAPPAERLQYVSVKVTNKEGEFKEAADPEAGLGNDVSEESHSSRNAISSNGRYVYWTDIVKDSALYVRDTVKQKSLQVNAAQEGLKASGEVRYQIASEDGTKVFFTDVAKLNNESHQGKSGGEDLYVCELEEGPERPTCKLKDLAPPPAGESTEVIGAVMGAGENGNTVYFVANAKLTEGAVAGSCSQVGEIINADPEGKCNVYVVRNVAGKWDAPELVAVISNADAPDWGVSGRGTFNITSRVSPSGQYLAFMSQLPITGYDNTDAHSGKPDQEVFLYDDTHPGEVKCPSCNPNPAQKPVGVLDTQHAGEGLGLLVDPTAKIWEGKWLAASLPVYEALNVTEAAYQPRYLLDDGRLFFNSADKLVPEDVNEREEPVGEGIKVGTTDVYQYEPSGLGSCGGPSPCLSLLSSGTGEHESSFLDASLNGDDAFFVSQQPLVPGDIDDVFDAYDARVCGAAACVQPPPPPPASCTSEASCRTGAPGTPGFAGTVSEVASGTNSNRIEVLGKKEEKKKTHKLTRAQKLKKALAACRHKYKHSKHKRVLCERQARHKYGPPSHHHKKKKK